MQRRPVWQQVALFIAIVVPAVAAILFILIGLMILLNPRSGPQVITLEALMNGLLTTALIVIAFPVFQRQCYWRTAAPTLHVSKRRMPQWPQRLRIRHAAFMMAGIGVLLFAYAPYGHQKWITGTLNSWAGGNASFTHLTQLIIVILPMALLLGLTFWLTSRDRRAAREGRLSGDDATLIDAEFHWMGGFATAFVMVSFLCWMLGYMIQRYLE